MPSPSPALRSLKASPHVWLWLVPILLFAVVWQEAGHLSAVVAALAALAYLALVQRRPVAAVEVLLLGILFNTVGLSIAFKVGLSVSTVKGLSFWKEGVVVGALLALWTRRPLRRFDALDIAAIAYVVLGLAYLLAPHLLVGNAAGSSLSLYARALDWRNDVFYVGVFVVFRHLRLGRHAVDRLLERVLMVVSGVAALGIVEAILPDTWNRVAVHDLGVTAFEHLVVGDQPSAAFSLTDVRSYTAVNGHLVLRIGSVLFDYLAVGFVFALGLGIAADIIARRRARWWVYAVMPVLGIALLLTQTRSAVIAGIVATVFALRHRSGKSVARRAVLARVVAILLLVGTPFIAGSGTLLRFVSAPHSNTAHKNSFVNGITVLEHNPMGRGLGTSAGGAQLLGGQQQAGGQPTVILTESQYLQIGSQLGVAGLALYLAVVLLLLRRLLHRRDDDPPALAPSAMSNVAVGTMIGLLFTQAFVNLELAVLFWGCAGLAVGVVDDLSDRRAHEPAGTPRHVSLRTVSR